MNRTVPALVAAAVLAVAAPAGAQPATGPSPATLTVTGQGNVERMPDRAIVTFSIVANDDLAARATSSANATYAALTAAMLGLGLGAAAISTTQYNLNYVPHPAVPDPHATTLYGYVVTRTVAVTTAKTGQVGAIVDAGIKAGATSVVSAAFSLSDDRGAYRAALAAAVADAYAQATTLAAAAHVHIVRVLQIGGSAYVPVQPVVTAMFKPQFAADMYAVVPTQLEPTSQTISASIGVTYVVAP